MALETVTAVDVSLEEHVGAASTVRTGDFTVVTLTAAGIEIDGAPVAERQLAQRLSRAAVIARVDRDVPAGRMIRLLARLQQAGATVSLETDEHSPARR